MSKGKHPKEQKTWQQQDPNWSQELQKYEKPVPSRDLLLKKLEEGKAPLTLEEFCLAFSLEHDADAVEGVRRRLKAMERDGQLLRNRRGAYGAISRLDLVAGVVQGHRDGHGVLYPEAGGDSLILPPKQSHGMCMHEASAHTTTTVAFQQAKSLYTYAPSHDA